MLYVIITLEIGSGALKMGIPDGNQSWPITIPLLLKAAFVSVGALGPKLIGAPQKVAINFFVMCAELSTLLARIFMDKSKDSVVNKQTSE